MSLIDGLLVTGILGTLALVFWSRVMKQSVLDSLREIRTFIREMGTVQDE